MTIVKTNDEYIAKLTKQIEDKGFEVDMFTVPHLDPNREFGKVGRTHAEIKKDHYLLEGFRDQDYISVHVSVWNYIRIDKRHVATGELLKQEFEVMACNESKVLLDW